MIFDYEPGEGEEGAEGEGGTERSFQTLNPDKEYVHAKAFLQKSSSTTGENLYDHLSDVLNKILAERPENIIDFFEEYSRKVKERRFKSALDHLEDIYVPKARYDLSLKIMDLFKWPVQRNDETDLELADLSQNNLVQLLYYFEKSGIGLTRQEMFTLTFSMRKLIHSEPIASIRFWGVIYGLYSNYYIVETELKEEEYMKRNEIIVDTESEVDGPKTPTEASNSAQKLMDEDEITMRIQQLAHEQQMGGEDSKFPRTLPPLPENLYKKPPKIPAEPSGVGVNAKVYYVTNELTQSWTQLPDVTPEQIQIARKIYKSFTGKLDTEIVTYPDFPGKEKEYLRAQIARISASTQISPLGYYTFDGGQLGAEDEEEEEVEDEEAGGGQKTSFKVNPRYDPPPLKDLTDGSMSFWVHHVQFILAQGRTSYWSPIPEQVEAEDLDEALGEEEEEEETKSRNLNMVDQPEIGPPLLTPLSEDAQIETVRPWSVRPTSSIMEEYATAVVRSHLWPGAYCFTTQGKMFQNIYLGDGLKFQVTNFSPAPLPEIGQDYVQGPEIMEMFDPTGVQEEEWRIAHLPKPKAPLRGEEESEEEEMEEEEEEEEDD